MKGEVGFVLATGPSLTQEDVDMVKGLGKVVCVSDSYLLAPWADALASTDVAWWDHKPRPFEGLRFGVMQPRTCRVIPLDAPTSLNSGALGILAAASLGCKEIHMLGFDLSLDDGAHFFGPHEEGLKQTPDHRFDVFMGQIAGVQRNLASQGVSLVNCSRKTKLNAVRIIPLEQAIEKVRAI